MNLPPIFASTTTECLCSWANDLRRDPERVLRFFLASLVPKKSYLQIISNVKWSHSLLARFTPRCRRTSLTMLEHLLSFWKPSFQTVAQEEQRQHLREQQVEFSSSHVLQRSLKIQRKRPNYRVVSPTRAKSRTPRPLPKAFPIWASFFLKQTQVKLHDLFPHPLRAVRISKKIPSLQLTQLDAESIICLFGQIIDSRCRDKNRPHSATVSLTTVAECGWLRW